MSGEWNWLTEGPLPWKFRSPPCNGWPSSLEAVVDFQTGFPAAPTVLMSDKSIILDNIPFFFALRIAILQNIRGKHSHP